jgi:hypothetical protein
MYSANTESSTRCGTRTIEFMSPESPFGDSPSTMYIRSEQVSAGQVPIGVHWQAHWGESAAPSFLTSRKVFGPKTDKCSAEPIHRNVECRSLPITRQEIRGSLPQQPLAHRSAQLTCTAEHVDISRFHFSKMTAYAPHVTATARCRSCTFRRPPVSKHLC